MFEKLILENLSRDFCVDNWANGFINEKSAFSFYENSEKILVLERFDLCKWFTKSRQAQDKICETENTKSDQFFDVNTTRKISGVNWDLHKDKLVFTFDEIVSLSST